jgi:integrase
MTHATAGGGEREVIAAARMLLSRMGLTAADLLTEPEKRPPSPTFADYIPVAAAAVSHSTRATYGSYWIRVEAAWGHRQIDAVTASEIAQFAEQVKATARVRRNSRGGRSTAENLIAAVRCLYRHAERDGLIREVDNPARKVDKPRRLPSTRRALGDTQLAEINQIAATTGDDPELDTLLLRVHTETACRRGGALNLRVRDLDPDQCLILLREKGETMRWQPVSPTLMTHLQDHAIQRGGAEDPTGRLLRYQHGVAITHRRYDHLWERLGRHLPWVATHNVSTHWLRHTTLTWVERTFGFAVAHAYAGHFDSRDNATTTYVKSNLTEVATALATLTGEPHPLAVNP